MDTETFPEIMKPAEAMRFLRIGKTLFFAEVQAGNIPATRIGKKQYRFSRAALAAYVRHGSAMPPAAATVHPELLKALTDADAVAEAASITGNDIPGRRSSPGHLSPEVREQKKRDFLELLRNGYTLKAAAAAVGVTDVAARNWRHADPHYGNEVQTILDSRQR